MVSYAMPRKLSIVADTAQSFALDNGAFSFWRSGKETDWDGYYCFVESWRKHPAFDWALIPDVIGGTEEENEQLVKKWPFHSSAGVPVWHLHESIDYLLRLCAVFQRVAIGSSGEFSRIGSIKWWGRMTQAMNAICDSDGRPPVKLHGLRMLDPNIFTQFPFSSADSTNVARNHTLDNRWNGTYQPRDKNTRALVIANRVEHFNSSPSWKKRHEQQSLFC